MLKIFKRKKNKKIEVEEIKENSLETTTSQKEQKEFRPKQFFARLVLLVFIVGVSFASYNAITVRARATENTYYLTNKSVVIRDAYNSSFDVLMSEDGGDHRVWYYSQLGKYVPKGTVVINSMDKYHTIQFDGLSITQSGNDQIVSLYCDTVGVTPYITLNRTGSRPGYYLYDVNNVEYNNAGTTTSSGGNAISAGVGVDLQVTTDINNFKVYLGSTSDVSAVTCYWQVESYNLYFNPNGGTIGGSTTTRNATVTYNSSNNNVVSGYTPTRTGYTFGGWYTSSGTQVYDANGKCVNGKGYWLSNIWQADLGDSGASLTLYAHWTPKSYTISFDSNKPSTASNNVSFTTTTKSVTYDATVTASKVPTIKGWTFNSWY